MSWILFVLFVISRVYFRKNKIIILQRRVDFPQTVIYYHYITINGLLVTYLYFCYDAVMLWVQFWLLVNAKNLKFCCDVYVCNVGSWLIYFRDILCCRHTSWLKSPELRKEERRTIFFMIWVIAHPEHPQKRFMMYVERTTLTQLRLLSREVSMLILKMSIRIRHFI